MSADLSIEDFAAFFAEIHGATPFPWQSRLAAEVANTGRWPEVLDLPTGSGKTAAIDVAVFNLALQADRGPDRRAPVRVAFVVDRRLVVDDAFVRAQKLAQTLATATGDGAAARVAARLRLLSASDPGSGERPPLVVRRLRGGIPREDDWARTPSQPTVLCSTVDQVGSRLMFRGYGLSDRMKPIHAGLIGSDCLILLDEAHLAEPFRQTLDWVRHYRGAAWRDVTFGDGGPWGMATLTATPADGAASFSLGADDRADPVLAARLGASKPARLVGPAKAQATKSGPAEGEEETDAEASTRDMGDADLLRRVDAIVAEVHRVLAELRGRGMTAPAIGVVVNRVARARAVHQRLVAALGPEGIAPVLLIGPARPVDRDALAGAELAPIRTGANRPTAPLILVATQCVEAGVDIDLDGLVTELAPLDALRQRFGRLNRAGRPFLPFATILAAKSDLSPRADDPVYGKTLRAAWDLLTTMAVGAPDLVVDFGIDAFEAAIAAVPIPPDAISRKDDAPVLMPAHLDLFAQTSPIPSPDPEIGFWLHGPNRQPASVSVIWRADIDPAIGDVRPLLLLVPPRSGEAIELPVWAVRRWLEGRATGGGALADIPTRAPEEDGRETNSAAGRKVFRWAGDDDRSDWIAPAEIRPGDTIVAPAGYGGVDRFGWNPGSRDPATDVADAAADPFAGRRFALRLAPGLVDVTTASGDGTATGERDKTATRAVEAALAEALSAVPIARWPALRDALAAVPLSKDLVERIDRLEQARGGAAGLQVHLDLYGYGNGPDADHPRGVVVVAPFGIRGGPTADEARTGATEDDRVGSIPGFALGLGEHCRDVEAFVRGFARDAGLSEALVADLALAGFLHDAGKADPRFQSLLAYGAPFGRGPGMLLAKSARRAPPDAGTRLGLTKSWRHEALSVRLAPLHPRFAEASDPELVLWLIGTHHGCGRPLYPHGDAEADASVRPLPLVDAAAVDLPPGAGPQSLGYDRDGLDWPGLFERLKARYGIWDLARLEAVLRLADHGASAAAEARAMAGEGRPAVATLRGDVA